MGPVIEALRGLADELTSARLSPVAGSLRPLLPELSYVLPLQPDPLDDRAAERHQILRGLSELLGTLGPVVLVLEDLHWADEQTTEFLNYLMADPPDRLSIVLTYRGEEVSALVRAVTAKLPSIVHHAHIVLQPLDAGQTGSLAASILETERVSEEFATHLCTRASGVPFAIEELLALLRERGTLVREGGRWARQAIDELDVPAGIRDPVLERITNLPGEGRAVVEAAAVLLEPATVAVLIQTCRSSSAEAQVGVEEALDSGLLVERGPGVGFRHVLAAQAVHEALPGPRRTDLHGRAAAALKRLDSPPLGKLSHHLRHAGQFEEWADVAERAADQAIALGHEDEAARLLEELLSHASLGAAQRQRLAVKLGEAAAELTYLSDNVISLLSDVLDDDLPRAVMGEITFWLATIVERTGGDWAVRRQLFTHAADALDQRPDLYARAMLGLGIPTAPGIPLAEHLQCLRQALRIVSKMDDPSLELFVRGKLAMVFVAVGDGQWRELTEQILRQTQGVPRQRREVNAYESVGEMACYAGHYGTADRLLTAARQGAGLCESPYLDLRVQTDMVLLDYLRGSWDQLSDTSERLVEQLASTPLAQISAELVLGCLALANGEAHKAAKLLRGVADQAEMLGWFDALAVALGALARHALTNHALDDVARRVDRMLAGLEAKEMWAPLARALPSMARVMIAVGRESEARALVARAARHLAELDAPLAPAALRFAEGYLRAAREDWAAAAKHFLGAAELYEAVECPYEAAQAREQAGLMLSAAGDVRAEEQLRGALMTYEYLGASWDLARCTKAARGHGLRLPVPHRGGRKGYGNALSPREAEVARLAAVGYTNKAIADELFLSQTTVSKHLSGAMRKLGVHTRAAVAARLDDRDTGPG